MAGGDLAGGPGVVIVADAGVADAGGPRGSPCAAPQTLIKGRPGARLQLVVAFDGGRRHLPVVALRRVA